MNIGDPPLEAIIKTGIRSAAQGVAWVWEAYGRDILAKKLGNKVEEIGIEAWQRIDWRSSADKYRESMRNQYGTTRVIGKTEPLSLEGIFTDVHFLEKPVALAHYNIEQLRQRKQYRGFWTRGQTRVPGLDLIQTKSRLFILGKPGAGKTTFLKHIVWQSLQGNVAKIPIFVSLKDLSDSKLSLMSFIVKQFSICQFPDAQPFVEHILEKGQAVVLFDALDEVQQQKGEREETINSLKDFTQQYRESPCLITCRNAAVEYTFEQFTYVELADFTGQQIRIYVRKWFDDNVECQRFLEQLCFPQNAGLRELASVPLLLSMLCLVFEETRAFPQRRVEIYQEALEALLKKWDAQRKITRDEIYRELSPKRKEQMLARLAAQNFEKEDFFITQQTLEGQIEAFLHTLPNMPSPDEIDSAGTLRAIEAQHGVITERASRIYSFAHLSFQEYFTARYIVADTTGKSLRGLLTAKAVLDSRWHEVILNTASLLNDASVFFELFLSACGAIIRDEQELVDFLKWGDERTRGYGESNRVAARLLYCALNLDLQTGLGYRALLLYDALFSKDPLKFYYDLDPYQDNDDEFNGPRQSALNNRLQEIEERFSADAVIDCNLVQLYHYISFFEDECDVFVDAGFAEIEKAYRALFLDLVRLVEQEKMNGLVEALKSLGRQTEEMIVAAMGQPVSGGIRPDEYMYLGFKNPNAEMSNQTIKNEMLKVMRVYRKIRVVEKLSDSSVRKLHDYFRANILLLGCLRLAAASNRQEIFNRLLLYKTSV